MKEFVRKYEHRIHGVLSCFDRVIFRGYLPIMAGWQNGSIPHPSPGGLRQPQTILA